MALMPEFLKLTPDEQAQLDAIKAAAKVRHEKARKAARRRGRVDFPMLPYECSWAYEQQFTAAAKASNPPITGRKWRT